MAPAAVRRRAALQACASLALAIRCQALQTATKPPEAEGLGDSWIPMTEQFSESQKQGLGDSWIPMTRQFSESQKQVTDSFVYIEDLVEQDDIQREDNQLVDVKDPVEQDDIQREDNQLVDVKDPVEQDDIQREDNQLVDVEVDAKDGESKARLQLPRRSDEKGDMSASTKLTPDTPLKQRRFDKFDMMKSENHRPEAETKEMSMNARMTEEFQKLRKKSAETTYGEHRDGLELAYIDPEQAGRHQGDLYVPVKLGDLASSSLRSEVTGPKLLTQGDLYVPVKLEDLAFTSLRSEVTGPKLLTQAPTSFVGTMWSYGKAFFDTVFSSCGFKKARGLDPELASLLTSSDDTQWEDLQRVEAETVMKHKPDDSSDASEAE